MLVRAAFLSLLVLSLFGETPDGAPKNKAATTPAAQAPAGSSNIRVQANEVIMPVTVTDEKGRFVSNLDQKDFEVFDEGKPQLIRYFSRERSQPVVVGFLFDMSNSTRLHWKEYQDAAIELVLTLLPDPDSKKFSGYLISYSNEPELLVNTTSDSEHIVERIKKMKPGGGSSLYDAIYMACTSRNLVKGEPSEPLRVLVIIGDGHDNASKKTLAQALEVAQRNLVTIYGISTAAFGFVTPDEQNLVKLCEETGGRVESPLNKVYGDVSGYLSIPRDEGNYALSVGTGAYASELANGMFRAISDITGEITTQYILRYIPDVPENKKTFRNVRVAVDLPNVRVRTRKGYYPN